MLTGAFARRVGVARTEWRLSYSFSPASNSAWGPPQISVRGNFGPFWEFVAGVKAYIYFEWTYAYLLRWVSEVPIASWVVVAEIIWSGDALNSSTELCSSLWKKPFARLKAVLNLDEGKFLLADFIVLLSEKCYPPFIEPLHHLYCFYNYRCMHMNTQTLKFDTLVFIGGDL